MALTIAVSLYATEREYLWPKDRMPDAQDHQIAAMTDISRAEGFVPDKYRRPYIDWLDAPKKKVGACMILISGGSYNNCCDVELVKMWGRELTALGVQCVNLVYRTPRPKGIPIYKTAWEDGQRAIRLVRSQSAKRGFDPEKIGVIGMSAGGHLTVLLATSSQTRSYEKVDALDELPCHVNWAVANAPAYVTSDGEAGTKALRGGYGPDVKMSKCFKFDWMTCPMSLHHGGLDPYSPNGSTLIYRQLRRMNVPAELHLYPNKAHGAFGFERAVEFMRQIGILGPPAPEEKLMDRYGKDDARAELIKEDIWPDRKGPYWQEQMNLPYIEWHIPAELKTKAIQIIYSGGGYSHNKPDEYEVAPVRRYLNEKGMTVVTLKYRSPRPKGMPKHIPAWADLQRAIKIVRSEAAGRGLDPDRIGIMGGSAGGHLTLMGVTSSLHQAYLGEDETDKTSCSVQWGIALYPAYALTDGLESPNTTKGNEDTAVLSPEFSFDKATSPMLFIHGDSDGWAAMNSVKAWEKLRAMGVQSELHTLALRPHCFQRYSSPGTGSYTFMDRIWEFLTEEGFNR